MYLAMLALIYDYGIAVIKVGHAMHDARCELLVKLISTLPQLHELMHRKL